VTHDSYADQLTKRIIIPLRLRALCLAPYTCPLGTAARMPAGYFWDNGPSLEQRNGTPVPKLGLTWAQAAGGIVSSLANLTTWDRALYYGKELPPRQQRQLKSLVSETTGKPISKAGPGNPGFGLGVQHSTSSLTDHLGLRGRDSRLPRSPPLPASVWRDLRARHQQRRRRTRRPARQPRGHGVPDTAGSRGTHLTLRTRHAAAGPPAAWHCQTPARQHPKAAGRRSDPDDPRAGGRGCSVLA
jgi:hypothetical protein